MVRLSERLRLRRTAEPLAKKPEEPDQDAPVGARSDARLLSEAFTRELAIGSFEHQARSASRLLYEQLSDEDVSESRASDERVFRSARPVT